MSKKKQSRLKKEIKSFRMLSSVAICVLLAGAVCQLNSHIHQNSLIGDLQKNVASLSSENDILAARLSQSNSLENFNQYRIAQAENYEKVDIAGMQYIHISGGEFARK